MKKNYILALILAFGTTVATAQVGINTTTPQATLDISLKTPYNDGDKAGVVIPSLSGDQIIAMDIVDLKAGTMIYANAISTDATRTIHTVSYWWYDGAKWVTFEIANPSFFYAPAVVLPTKSTNLPDYVTFSGEVFTCNLYSDVYAVQFGMTDASTSIKSNSASTLPVIAASKIEYFITYYDKDVFTDVTLSDSGVLTYKIIASAAITEKSFMNIVFKIK